MEQVIGKWLSNGIKVKLQIYFFLIRLYIPLPLGLKYFNHIKSTFAVL